MVLTIFLSLTTEVAGCTAIYTYIHTDYKAAGAGLKAAKKWPTALTGQGGGRVRNYNQRSRQLASSS